MTQLGASVYSSPVNFQIPQTPPENLDPKIRSALVEVYAAIQNIIQALVNNTGIGQQPVQFWNLLAATPSVSILSGNLGRLYVVAGEPIPFGAAVALYNNAGVLTARNANATNNTKICRGFCSTIGGMTIGNVGEVIIGTGVVPITGLTVGANYYLSTVNGLVAAVPAVAAGNVEQFLGFALDSEHLFYNLGYWIQH